jgi:hypothetical protein
MTITTRVIRIMLQANSLPFIEVQAGLRVQVLRDITDLPRCQKHQFAAFIENQGYLLVWDDDPKRILGRAEDLEAAILRMIWGKESAYPNERSEKEGSDMHSVIEDLDVEGLSIEKPRRLVLLQSWLTAFTLTICVVGIGAGWREIAIEISIDQDYKRVCFLLAVVPQFWLSLVNYIQRQSIANADITVLLPSSRRQCCTSMRASTTSFREHEVLFRHSTTTTVSRVWGTTTFDHPVSCV